MTAALVGVGAAGLVAYELTPRAGSVIGSSSISAANGPGAGLPRLGAGRLAPGFRLPRLGGGAPVSLAAVRGHPVVLNFFASWCPDCRAELRAFARVSSAPHGAVRFLAVDTNDHSPGRAQALLAAAGDRYPVGLDPSASVANGRYLVEALPVTVFIDARGRIVGQAFGAQTVSSLDRWVRTLQRASGRQRRGGSHG